jgi:hypothetical protein
VAKLAPLPLIAPDGSSWGVYRLSLPETIMLGLATRWYFCDPDEQDIGDKHAAQVHCRERMELARKVAVDLSRAKHAAPGGNP